MRCSVLAQFKTFLNLPGDLLKTTCATLADMDITSAQTTYIYRLNCDLLLHIFEMNADMFTDDDALLSTRCASQVCRGWRSLLLRTSWIWARLLDLDWPLFRARPPPEWLAELLQRTGNAPLWVKAQHSLSRSRNSPPHISRFIFAILTINWHRVERLFLSVEDLDWSVQSIKNLWGWMYTPAPQLKEFDVSFGILQWDHPPSVPLFSGNSPALRSMVLITIQSTYTRHGCTICASSRLTCPSPPPKPSTLFSRHQNLNI